MADMGPRTISFRADQDTADALAELLRDETSQTQVIKDALIRAAREHRRARLRRQARALAADPVDLAEMRAVQEDMEPLRAW